jgi:hypothetical protein
MRRGGDRAVDLTRNRLFTPAVLLLVSHSELILFGLVEGIVQPDIMRFMRDMRIIQFI